MKSKPPFYECKHYSYGMKLWFVHNRNERLKTNNMNITDMTISQIATLIRNNWSNVYFGAVPYLDAMRTMNSINDNYGDDSGKSIIRYFLGNATTWRGEVARTVKAELNKRLKGQLVNS